MAKEEETEEAKHKSRSGIEEDGLRKGKEKRHVGQL
jgi:hypothetical protein